MNIYNYCREKNLKFHYGNGAKNELKKENKKYNFKFYHYIESVQQLKFCSVGFDDLNEFINSINPIKGNYFIYEYIFSNQLCRPYIDYEIYCDIIPEKDEIKVMIDWISVNILYLFNKKYNIYLLQENLIILDSSGIKNDKYKLSLHIIINSKYVFKTNKDILEFAQELHKIDKNVDLSVYSTDRMMRCILSAKEFNDLRTLKLLDNNYNINDIKINEIEPYLITYIPINYEIIKVNSIIKKINKNKQYSLKPFMTNEVKIDKMINLIETKFHSDAYYTKYNYIEPVSKYKCYQFNYMDRNEICFTGHKHDNIGFYCYIDNQCNVIAKCFSINCKEQKYIIGNLNDMIDNNMFININDQFLLENNTVIDKMGHLSSKLKTLAFKSPMGTGKTQLIEAYIKKYNSQRILIISTRQSYTNNVNERFKNLDFVNYLENKQFYKFNRIIVQLESLDLILKNIIVEQYDLIILDELESILYQFSSSTISGKAKETFKLFYKLCKSNKTKLLVLDADFGVRSMTFIEKLGLYEVIQNNYKAEERTIILTKNYESYIKAIIKSIDDKENICIISLATKNLYDMTKLLEEKKVKYILHTRDTDDKLKKELKTVNDYWSKYQVVLFSPTISVGVDFSLKYFDRIYSYIIPNCASPRMYLQMLGRIRTIKYNEILTYYDNITTKVDEYLYNYDEMNNYYKYVCTESFLSRKIEQDENGNIYSINKIGLFEEILIHNHIEDLNKCSKYFMTSLNLLCLKKNYRLLFKDIHKIDIKLEDKNIEVYKDKIINSLDIDTLKCNQILLKINANDATEGEKLSVYKKQMKTFWKVQNIDKSFMDKYFRKENIIVNLRYLLDKDLSNCTDYIDNNIEEKSNIIKDIIDKLGFDLNNIDRVITKEEFYKGKTELFTNSDFSKKYENVRILFDKPKGKLNISLNGSFLTKFLNGFINEFGLELVCKEKSKRIVNKISKISFFNIKIIDIYKPFI